MVTVSIAESTVQTSVTCVFFHMSERRCICVSASNRGYIARTQGTSPAHCGPGSPVQPAQSARSRLWAAQSFPRPLHSHGSIRARMKIRLARQPGGCTTRPREHTTSAHIAVADITCKRRRGRTPGAVTAVTERCRCGLGPRFRDAEQVSVRMNYTQDAAGTTYLSALNPPWVH